MINNELKLTLKNLLISSLLLTTISDCIRGFSIDIVVPIANEFLPGDVKKPYTFLNVNVYLSRFFIRVINLLGALIIIQYILKKI